MTREQCDAVPDRTGDPEWSPDGQRIVYTFGIDALGCPEDPRIGFDLRIMGADGSGDTLLVPQDSSSNINTPSWSPDGTQIAFERDGSTVVIAASGGPETLVPGTGWSPDWQSLTGPRRSDYKNAAQFCKAERAFWGDDGFAQRYGGGASAHGRCVSGKPG